MVVLSRGAPSRGRRTICDEQANWLTTWAVFEGTILVIIHSMVSDRTQSHQPQNSIDLVPTIAGL